MSRENGTELSITETKNAPNTSQTISSGPDQKAPIALLPTARAYGAYVAGDTGAIDEEVKKESAIHHPKLSMLFNQVSLDGFLSAIVKRKKANPKAKASPLAVRTILERYKNDPVMMRHLLTTPGQAVAYSDGTDKTILGGTALQIALIAGDVQIIKMLTPHLDAIDPKLKPQQRQQQFPEGQEEKEQIREQQDRDALYTMIEALEQADEKECQAILEKEDPNAPGLLRGALNTFRHYLEPQAVITKGKQFNLQLFIDAIKLYDEKFFVFGNCWNSKKNLLFWRKVIGTIERFLPTCDAQAVLELYEYVENKPGNDLLVHDYRPNKNDFPYYPLKPFAGLGYSDFAIIGCWGVVQQCPRGLLADCLHGAGGSLGLKNYIERKQLLCKSLCNPVQNQNLAAP